MPAKFQISYQGTLDYFCGIYAVINAVGYACSSFKVMTSSEKEAFFRCFMKYLIDNNLIEQVVNHGTTCVLEEKYLLLARDYMKENYHILIQWKKLTALPDWRDLTFRKTFQLLRQWMLRKDHSCIVRVDTPKTGDHWTVFQKVKFPVSYLVDSYHFLKINFANLAWKPRRKKKSSKETQLMKEGIFFISAKQLS